MVTNTAGRKRRARKHPTAAGEASSGVAAPLVQPFDDINMRTAALLFDMAAIQRSEASRMGYKRAANAIVGLPFLVSDAVAAGTVREIPFIGPASARIVTEAVQLGHSPTVDAAVEQSGQQADVAARRQLGDRFLSYIAMQQALAAPLAEDTVAVAHYRGDFQMHSTYSDGGETLPTMVRACMDLGHQCLGITDHSYGLPVARGMTMETAARQRREIEKLNEKYAGKFRIFRGIEANILADGTLDLQLDERAHFEYVVASPHSLLRRSDDQTARMLGAVRSDGVAMLGHPRGRMFGKRAGVVADWDRVFEAAAALDVAIELDGNWHRQDLDFELACRALAAGCLFALDSDAHSIGELRFTSFAIAHARLAGIPAERVINTWSNERLEEWMRTRMSSCRT